MDIVAKNLKDYRDAAPLFLETFGVRLFTFWNHITRFDIVKFDEWLETPENVSCEEVIRTKYGVPAVELIKSLL